MKASNASSAAALVSAIQISCNARLAFGCWLFGNLASTFAVLCTQQRCSRVLGQTSPAAFQNPSPPMGEAEPRGRLEPDAVGIGGVRLAIAHTRLADGDRADTGHHLALRQVTVAGDPPVGVLWLQI